MDCLSSQKWVDLLSRDRQKNDEELILMPRLLKSGEMRIKKGHFEHYFGKSNGLQFQPGKEIEIVSVKGAPTNPRVPQWALDQLAMQDSEKLCITKKRDRFYLKAMEIRELETEIIGPIIFDTFTETKVTRNSACTTELERMTDSYIDGLLGRIGKLNHDPLAHLKHTKGFIGLLAIAFQKKILDCVIGRNDRRRASVTTYSHFSL